MKPYLGRLLQPVVVIFIVGIIAVAAIAITFIMASQKPAESYVTPTVGPIVEEVDTTGTVKAANTLDLSFQTSGNIAAVYAPVGVHVNQGATLAVLSGADLRAQVEGAQAALAVQQAKLAGIQAGSRPESVAVSQAAVAGAQSALSQSKTGIIQVSQDAYAKSDDAIHNKVDQFISNSRTLTPSLVFTLSDSQLANSIIAGRVTMEGTLSDWQSDINALDPNPDNVDVSVLASKTTQRLLVVQSYLDQVANALTKVVVSGIYTQATIQGYQNNIATARANISADITALNAAQTAEKSAAAGLASAQSQLTLAQAPATATDLAAQQAQVAAAQASLDLAQAQLAKTVLSAPIGGIITRNDAHAGETATPGVPLVSMISDSQFQVESYVSEADLAKLKVGDAAAVILDAYQNAAPFSTHVIAIDPAATVANGISSYKVTLQFDANDPRIQAGLTGSIKVTTQSKASALSVPTSAIITRGSSQFVMRQSASGDALVPVVVGIASDTGMTEIVSGLSAGDRIRTFGVQN